MHANWLLRSPSSAKKLFGDVWRFLAIFGDFWRFLRWIGRGGAKGWDHYGHGVSRSRGRNNNDKLSGFRKRLLGAQIDDNINYHHRRLERRRASAFFGFTIASHSHE
jgi:hypothetical protein